MRYDTLLLDNDGVLLEYGFRRRERFHEEMRSILDEYEVEYTEDDVDAFTGWTERDTVERFCDEQGVDPEELWREREYRFAELKRENMEDGLKGLYDDVEVVWELADELKLGVVSNNQHRTIEHLVSIFDLDDVLDTYYGKEPGMEGFERMKPDPHYLDAAVEELDAEDVLYVGDSWFDVAAARNAGVDVAYIERDHNADREPGMEPDYWISSLEELPGLLEEDGCGER